MFSGVFRSLLDAVAEILVFMAGMGREQFLADPKTVKAIAANLTIIGEAARHVPNVFAQAQPAIPWVLLNGMRNRTASLFAAGRQAGPVNAAGEMKSASAELVQCRFQGGDQAPLLRLHQHPDRAEERYPPVGEYAPAGRFVHDDEVGVELFPQDDRFALSAIQLGLEARWGTVAAVENKWFDLGTPGKVKK